MNAERFDALSQIMTSERTRRRDTLRNEETWLIFLADVHIGTIGRRAGVPNNAEQWGWWLAYFQIIPP